MKRLFSPLGRTGFLVSLPVIGFLYYASLLLVRTTVPQYPEQDGPLHLVLVYDLIWFIPAVIVQIKRLRSIGVNAWISLVLSLAAASVLFFRQNDWQGLVPLAVWALALAYKRQAEPEEAKPE